MQLTVRDASRILNVPEQTIYRWISQGTLRAYRVNDQYHFNRDELLEWATLNKVNVSVEAFQETADSTNPLPTLVASLEEGGVHDHVGGSDAETMLRAVVDRIRLPDSVDREFLYEVLLAREALGSTAVGEGIAIPHVRNPILLQVPRPSITLCYLEHAVDVQSADGKPVSIIFFLIATTARAHLHLLARLSFVLRDSEFRALLARRAPGEEIFKAARRVEEALSRGAA